MAAAHVSKEELIAATKAHNEQQELPDGIGTKTNYLESDIRHVQHYTQQWTKGFDSSVELEPSKEEDIRMACQWVRECFDKNFNEMARAGGWRRYDPPSDLKPIPYNEDSDSIALLLLFGEQFTPEQVARSVNQAFFTSIKDNRPFGCKNTGVSLMHVRGFPVLVPSEIRCVVFKCWIRYRPRDRTKR